MDIYKYKKHIEKCVWGTCGFKIFHAFARFYNFGDNALAFGVKNIFQKYFLSSSRFINVDVHTTIFDLNVVNEINKIGNLLLVGGGGLIHTWNSRFWLFNMEKEEADKLKVPMLFYGLGYNNFNDIELNKDAIENIEMLKRSAIAFSVRNDGSAERLRELGLDFDEVPDPGFFVDAAHPRPNINGKYVILQIAYDAPNERGLLNDVFFLNLCEVCKCLLEKGYSVVLTPHCYPDIKISEEIVKNINNSKIFIWDWFSIIREDNVVVGLGYYKYASFVLAMRGHAQICPIGMGVPVISIINHPKHLGLLRKLKQENLMVMVNDKDFLNKIFSLISYVEDNVLYIKEQYSCLMDEMLQQTAVYVSELSQKVLSIKCEASIINFIPADSVKRVKMGGGVQKLQYKIWKHLGKKLRKKGIIQ